MKRLNMQNITKVGRYTLGTHRVDLFFDPRGRGGNFEYGAPSDVLEICVGGRDEWWHTLTALVHEALEAELSNLGARFVPDWDYAHASDTCAFMMNHAQFSEAVGRVANFLAACVPDVSAAYNQAKKRTRLRPMWTK